MDAERFVQELAALAPSTAELQREGLSSEEARDFRKSYFCVRRADPLEWPKGAGQLVELLRHWDLSTVEIGMVQFRRPPGDTSAGVCIGCVEADPLLILPGGELVVHEFGTDGHLLWTVAKSGDHLLDALIIAERFLGRRVRREIALNDYQAARSVALQCASAAGGGRHLDFYRMLVGADE
jgi:hypothetical protein